MRIGIDARMYGAHVTGGIGNYIKHLVQYLEKNDRENTYYIFLLENNYNDFQSSEKNFVKVKTKAHWYAIAEQTTFLLQLLSYKLDLMHFPNFNIPIFYPRKFITTIHDTTPLD